MATKPLRHATGALKYHRSVWGRFDRRVGLIYEAPRNGICPIRFPARQKARHMGSSLLDLVSASVPLKRRGRDWWAPCPFHSPDKTGSFKVGEYRGKQHFHCFSCGARGDAIDWLRLTRNLTFAEASRELGKPVKPDPAIVRARQVEQRRQRAINAYRDCNPDCVCPDWLIMP